MAFDGGPAPSESTTRFRLLYDLACAFAARIELDELFPFVVTQCRETFDAMGASVLLLDADGKELYFPYVAEDDPTVLARLLELRFPADRGIAGWVINHGRAVRVDDVQNDPRFFTGIDRATGFTTRTVLCAPLKTYQGVIGALQVLNKRHDGRFTDDDLAFLEALAGSVAVAIENARLFARVKASEDLLRAQVGALRRDMARRNRFDDIVGSSPAMLEVFRLMESAAASPIAVLIEGETGTGKELVARGIHRASARGEAPFLAVNCAAVTETLLESELFGHRRGAFTGATADHRGLFEAASGGTIFLDEVGEMPLAMQAKLLRVLQQSEVVPVGETRPRKVDVRVVSATNRDLQAEVARQAFRQDLYYRLAVFPIELPPLRERRDDVPLLVDRLLRAAAERHQREVPGIDPTALDALQRYEWPGNVRELENVLERAIALSRPGELISAVHFPAHLRDGAAPRPAASAAAAVAPAAAITDNGPGAGLRAARAQFEADYIRQMLAANNRNVSRTARALGLSRVMLQKKMKEYGLRDS
ncbi:MAG: sigma 54-interacting transcriptional regulator [Deltaproteobacteria bacterium]|nr:sigma 54-interacting transcriptional regulator [Deltaproteobacteria bacterium]